MLKRTLLLGVGIVVSLVLAGDVFAAKSEVPERKSLGDTNINVNPPGASSGFQGSEAFVNKGLIREEAKESHTTNQEYRNKIRTGQLPAPADWGNPDYCVSPAVKRDLRIQRIKIDAPYLKRYAIHDGRVGEGFWINQRDGTEMLIDPHISQNLR